MSKTWAATLSGRPVSGSRAEQISKTVGYCAIFMSLGLVAASLGPTLPGLAEHAGVNLKAVSFLFTVVAFGTLIGAFKVGQLYDRLPGHPLMGIMVVVMAVMMAVIPLMPWLWGLVILFLLSGIAQGSLHVGANTLMIWLYRGKVGPFVTGSHFFFGVGAFLAPIIVARSVLISGDINWAYWVLALLVLPVAAWLLRLPSPNLQMVSAGERIGRINYWLVFLFGLFFFLYVGIEVSFGGWIFSYALTMGLAQETTAAYLTSTFWGMLTVGRLLAVPVAARFRPVSIIWVNLSGCFISVGSILLWPDSLVVTWLGTIGAGLFMASVFPLTLAVAERRLPITGRVTSLFLIGGSLGAMGLPWLIGLLFESVGPQVTMGAIMIDIIITVAVFTVLIWYTGRSEASGA